jgi:hypothetical protein
VDRVPELTQGCQYVQVDPFRRGLPLDDPAVQILVRVCQEVLKGVQGLRAEVARMLVHERPQNEVRLAEAAPPGAK